MQALPIAKIRRVVRRHRRKAAAALADWVACARFLFDPHTKASFDERSMLVRKLREISREVKSPHTQEDILTFARAILSSRDRKGVVVEAGCYKGSSTAKFSLAAGLAGKELVVFDSFQGIPDNSEPHDTSIFGGRVRFGPGDYQGTLEEVRESVARYGRLECCRFVAGWFADTLPNFREPVAAVYLDVDLVASTRTCLRYLYPLLLPGGVVVSHDGHLPLVIDLLDDNSFWVNEIGVQKPRMIGLREQKLVTILKE